MPFSLSHASDSRSHAVQAALGLNAGMDQEGGGTQAIQRLARAIQDGKTTPNKVAAAFARQVRIRVRLGMFDPPGTASSRAGSGNITQYDLLNASDVYVVQSCLSPRTD